jgi:hypothetical protein
MGRSGSMCIIPAFIGYCTGAEIVQQRANLHQRTRNIVVSLRMRCGDQTFDQRIHVGCQYLWMVIDDRESFSRSIGGEQRFDSANNWIDCRRCRSDVIDWRWRRGFCRVLRSIRRLRSEPPPTAQHRAAHTTGFDFDLHIAEIRQASLLGKTANQHIQQFLRPFAPYMLRRIGWRRKIDAPTRRIMHQERTASVRLMTALRAGDHIQRARQQHLRQIGAFVGIDDRPDLRCERRAAGRADQRSKFGVRDRHTGERVTEARLWKSVIAEPIA